MGIISLLIKIFFFYMIYNILVGLWKAYQTYSVIKKQAQQGVGGTGQRQGTFNQKKYQSEDSIEAKFKVVDEKDV